MKKLLVVLLYGMSLSAFASNPDSRVNYTNIYILEILIPALLCVIQK